MPMYWSIHQYPSLAARPRAERQDIVRAALKQNRSSFGFRLLVVFAAIVAAAIGAGSRFAPSAGLLDFRTWIAPVAGALFIYAYLLVEINGAIHTAVKKYLANKKDVAAKRR
jgi:hypothetical protein